jgi:hypothetical protein
MLQYENVKLQTKKFLDVAKIHSDLQIIINFMQTSIPNCLFKIYSLLPNKMFTESEMIKHMV